MNRAARLGIGFGLTLITIGAGIVALHWIAERDATTGARDGSGMSRATNAQDEAEVAAASEQVRGDAIDASPLSRDGDPDFRGTRRDPTLDREPMHLRGWVITHATPNGGDALLENGTLVLRASKSSPATWRQEIPVDAGHFQFTAPADTTFEVERLELGGQPLMTRIRQFKTSNQVEIEGWWVEPTLLHVVDARSHRELGGLRIEGVENDSLADRVTDGAGGSWPQLLTSPVRVLPPILDFMHDRESILSRVLVDGEPLRVGAPGFGSAIAEIDPYHGGEKTVELAEAGRVVVRVDRFPPRSSSSASASKEASRPYRVRVRRLRSGPFLAGTMVEIDGRSNAVFLLAGADTEDGINVSLERLQSELAGLGDEDAAEFWSSHAMQFAKRGEFLSMPTCERGVDETPATVTFEDVAPGLTGVTLEREHGGAFAAAIVVVESGKTATVRLEDRPDVDEAVPNGELVVRAHDSRTGEPIALKRANVKRLPLSLNQIDREARGTVADLAAGSGAVLITAPCGFERFQIDVGAARWPVGRSQIVRIRPGRSEIDVPIDRITGLVVEWGFANVVQLNTARSGGNGLDVDWSTRVRVESADGDTVEPQPFRIDSLTGEIIAESRFALSHPGRFTIRFPKDRAFEGLAPIEVDVPEHTIVRQVVHLHD